MLLEHGSRCWSVGKAGHAAILIDVEAYFNAAVEVMSSASRSIHFLNWAFEPQTRLRPGAKDEDIATEDIARFLKRLADERPTLDVRLLCWQSALPVAATQKFFPLLDRGVFVGSRVKFVLDGKLPTGASHHQKAIIVDDAIAFCGGADVGQDRWDTSRHLDDDPRRMKNRHRHGFFTSRHEVMAIVDGEPAAALGELFRRRWQRCVGESLDTPEQIPGEWPTGVSAAFHDVRVGLSRTVGAWRREPEVRECEALHLASIAAAKHCIYMENQYFTSEVMAEALARRLGEAAGPDVILISTGKSPSYFDQLTMDPTRSRFIERLKAADRFGRFQMYSPVTTLGRDIIVHAKIAVIDDRLVRIGSANMNNRSFGFDTECDISLEAEDAAGGSTAEAIGRLRTDLLAHWLGCTREVVETAVLREGGVCRGVESLREAGYTRLRPIAPQVLGPLKAVIAALHIGDPMSPRDSFKPWKRRQALAQRREMAGLGLSGTGVTPGRGESPR